EDDDGGVFHGSDLRRNESDCGVARCRCREWAAASMPRRDPENRAFFVGSGERTAMPEARRTEGLTKTWPSLHAGALRGERSCRFRERRAPLRGPGER